MLVVGHNIISVQACTIVYVLNTPIERHSICKPLCNQSDCIPGENNLMLNDCSTEFKSDVERYIGFVYNQQKYK